MYPISSLELTQCWFSSFCPHMHPPISVWRTYIVLIFNFLSHMYPISVLRTYTISTLSQLVSNCLRTQIMSIFTFLCTHASRICFINLNNVDFNKQCRFQVSTPTYIGYLFPMHPMSVFRINKQCRCSRFCPETSISVLGINKQCRFSGFCTNMHLVIWFKNLNNVDFHFPALTCIQFRFNMLIYYTAKLL